MVVCRGGVGVWKINNELHVGLLPACKDTCSSAELSVLLLSFNVFTTPFLFTDSAYVDVRSSGTTPRSSLIVVMCDVFS